MPTRPRLKGADARLLKGYAPLVGLIVLYALIVILTPSVAREKETTTAGAGSVRPGTGPIAGTPGAPGATDPTGGTGTAGGGGGGTAGGGGGGGGVPAGGAPCPDGRTFQIEGDPYSPPCIHWEPGTDNGGATSAGVTAEQIKLTYRIDPNVGNLFGLISQLGGGKLPNETLDDLKRTLQTLVQYFNQNFQLYGRQILVEEFTGTGDTLAEFTGGGQAGANADAARAKELGAFGDISALTEPYAAQLRQNGIMAFGPAYMSREWYESMAPYAWSIVPDCTSVVEINSAALASAAGQNADYAGPALQGRPRKLGIVYPETPIYRACAELGAAVLKQRSGVDAKLVGYRFSLQGAEGEAQNVLDQLAANEITTVLLGADPLLINRLVAKAEERPYQPEWVVVGVALTDADIIGQIMHQGAWSRAFGVSMLGPQTDRHNTLGYRAYQRIDPNTEPSIAVDIFYYQLYQVVIGLQLAGPNLNPDTFSQGMFSYPGSGAGLAGTWHFGPGDYTAQDDGLYIYWDGNAISDFNGEKGRYIAASERFTKDTAPAQVPPMFGR